MENGDIPDSAITASEDESGYRAYEGRLNNAANWWAGYSPTSNPVWIQVNLGDITEITGIKTQGDGGNERSKDWVSKLSVEYTADNDVSMLTSILDTGGSVKVWNVHNTISHVVSVLWLDSDDMVTIFSPTSGTSWRLQNCQSMPPWFLHSDCV